MGILTYNINTGKERKRIEKRFARKLCNHKKLRLQSNPEGNLNGWNEENLKLRKAEVKMKARQERNKEESQKQETEIRRHHSKEENPKWITIKKTNQIK